MPEPIHPGIKKAVTPNIGITAFYIKSQPIDYIAQ